MAFFAEGVEIEFEGRAGDVPDATVQVIGTIGELTDRIVALERAGEEVEPKLASYLAEARSNLVLAASAVLASVDYKCTLATPPEDIRARPGPDGNMVHRCFHKQPHCWDGTWRLITCPGP
jgi:hypothetical protein